MKKLLLIASVLSIVASNANASVYGGIGLSQSNISYSKNDVKLSNGDVIPSVDKDQFLDKKTVSPNVFIGYEFENDTFTELSFTHMSGKKDGSNTGLVWADSGNPATVDTKVKMSMTDAVGGYTYKLNNVGLFGAIGLAYTIYEDTAYFKDKDTTRLTSRSNEYSLGYNAKLGVEYRFVKEFALRTDIKYTDPMLKNVERMITYNVSAKYTF